MLYALIAAALGRPKGDCPGGVSGTLTKGAGRTPSEKNTPGATNVPHGMCGTTSQRRQQRFLSAAPVSSQFYPLKKGQHLPPTLAPRGFLTRG
jgi:hypothetical protein